MEDKKNVFNVEIKIEKEEFEKALDKAFNKKSKDVKVDGFRKGKVPKDIYLKKFGKESLYMDAVDVLLPEAYEKALKEGNYEPIIEPKVDLKSIDENGCVFSFVITTKPAIDIKKYKNLKVKKEEVKVSKEEIDVEIENMLNKYSELVVKEYGAVSEHDIAVIDFEGFKDGKAFDGGKAENYSLEIGSNTFIKGFEEQIIGMKKDEEKDITVTFPEDYGAKDLAGCEVCFKVKVNEIKEKVKRELDEEFFEDLGMDGVNSKETLEENVKKTLESQKEIEIEQKYVDEILKEIAKNTEIEIPEELVENELRYMLDRFNQQLMMQGMNLDIYYEITKSKEEDLKNNMKEEAINHIKYRFILEEIKDKENISVTKEEIDSQIDKMCSMYGMEKEELIKQTGGIDAIEYELSMEKTIDFLKKNN